MSKPTVAKPRVAASDPPKQSAPAGMVKRRQTAIPSQLNRYAIFVYASTKTARKELAASKLGLNAP